MSPLNAAAVPAPPPKLLDVAALAAYAGISTRTAQTLIYHGHLPVVKVGRLSYVRTQDVDGWIDENTRPPRDAVS